LPDISDVLSYLVVYILSKRFRFVIILKDICNGRSKVSIRDIINAGGLKEFIEEHVEKKGILPSSAIQVFSRKKLQGLIEAIRMLRSLNTFDVEVYFITPFGLLWEDEPIVPYSECLDELTPETIKHFFSVFNVDESIFDLIESEPDLLYVYVNNKLLRILDLIEYIPRNTLAIVVSDTGFISNRDNIKAVYPSQSLITIFRKYGVKISQDTFAGSFLYYLSLFFFKLSNEAKKDFLSNYLRTAKNRPREFLDLITSPEALIFLEKSKNQSILKFIKKSDNDEGASRK